VADRVAVRVLVRGRVQGVWYRQSCAQEARARQLGGWVRNLPDGSVEVWIEGPRPGVEEVLSWCRVGPPGAHVTGLEIVDVAATGLDRFDVR
jgi:acylphosphatase